MGQNAFTKSTTPERINCPKGEDLTIFRDSNDGLYKAKRPDPNDPDECIVEVLNGNFNPSDCCILELEAGEDIPPNKAIASINGLAFKFDRININHGHKLVGVSRTGEVKGDKVKIVILNNTIIIGGGLTTGKVYFADINGDLVDTVPVGPGLTQKVGIAISETELFIMQSSPYQIT